VHTAGSKIGRDSWTDSTAAIDVDGVVEDGGAVPATEVSAIVEGTAGVVDATLAVGSVELGVLTGELPPTAESPESPYKITTAPIVNTPPTARMTAAAAGIHFHRSVAASDMPKW